MKRRDGSSRPPVSKTSAGWRAGGLSMKRPPDGAAYHIGAVLLTKTDRPVAGQFEVRHATEGLQHLPVGGAAQS